jgi:hypothetical protein
MGKFRMQGAFLRTWQALLREQVLTRLSALTAIASGRFLSCTVFQYCTPYAYMAGQPLPMGLLASSTSIGQPMKHTCAWKQLALPSSRL